MRAGSVFLAVVLASSGCTKKPDPDKNPTVASASASAKPLPPAAAAAEKAVGGDGKLDPNDPKHGTRKLMGLDVPVFIDGVQGAVFRYGELPPIAPRTTESGGIRYNLSAYLKGIGVDLAALKSVQFYGNGDRIASVEGAELRKEPKRFEFSFSSGDTGSVLQQWDGSGLKNEFVVHEIHRVAVYVKKPVASIDKTKQCHLTPDGECTGEVPGTDPASIAKGTRIYLDGKMMGFVKRRQVTDAMIVGAPAADPADNKYSVARLLDSMHIDVSSIKSLEMMAGDDVIGRQTGERFLAEGTSTTFSLPSHNHGKVRFHVPADFQANSPNVADKDGLCSAVLVYKTALPPTTRDLVPISEDTDTSVQVAAIDDGRPAALGNAQRNKPE